MIKLVQGVGINDSDFPTHIVTPEGLKRMCPLYRAWSGLLARTNSPSYKEKEPTYNSVTVAEEWLSFSNFRAWAIQQPYTNCHLDKDILYKGNSIYSADTCVFVPNKINTLLIDRAAKRGVHPLGVAYVNRAKDMINELSKPYRADVQHMFKRKYLGSFATPEEAHKAWQLGKASAIEEAVLWWRFTSAVNHSFQDKVAEALWERCERLRYDALNENITQSI